MVGKAVFGVVFELMRLPDKVKTGDQKQQRPAVTAGRWPHSM